MVISVPRNSGLFTEPVADELNKAFYSINDKIEKYESKDLDFKEDVQYLATDSNSFKGGKARLTAQALPAPFDAGVFFNRA